MQNRIHIKPTCYANCLKFISEKRENISVFTLTSLDYHPSPSKLIRSQSFWNNYYYGIMKHIGSTILRQIQHRLFQLPCLPSPNSESQCRIEQEKGIQLRRQQNQQGAKIIKNCRR